MSSNTPQQHSPANDDRSLVDAVTRVLDEQTDALDGRTLSRLTQARAAAMAARAQQAENPLARWSRGLMPTSPLGSGVAAAALTVLLVAAPLLLLGPGGLQTRDAFEPVGPATALAGEPVDELEIVLAGDIEMLEDLEFYEWLATQPVG